ncbi:hypothetical protein FDECE_14311 [Fusarium decemcellulare]|nr:hypothetical protein FDECE_14311 [Fusarium decemcellulare]
METQHGSRPRKPRRSRKRRKVQSANNTPSQPPHNDLAALEVANEEKEKDDSEGEDCELHAYELRHDNRGEDVTLRVGTTCEYEPPEDKSHRAALVLIRDYIMGETKQLRSTNLEVRSKYIKKALREVIGTYPGVSLMSAAHIRIPSPPKCLFHYRDELEDYATRSDDPVMKSHIHLCLGYMTRVLAHEIAVFETLVVQSKEPAIEHQHLWMIFKPGILLYEKLGDMEVVSCLIEANCIGYGDNWRLVAKRIQYNGQVFGYVTGTMIIKTYDGAKPISELGVLPLDLHPERERIRQDLTLRARKYLSLSGSHYRSYVEPTSATSASHSQVQHRVIIDDQGFRSALSMRPLCFIPDTALIQATPDHLMKLGEDEMLICHNELGGFNLARRNWALFNVEHIQDVQFNSDAFQQLVFSPDKKRLIQSLVEQRHAEDSGFDDLIEGKGKGLIFLLHGPPGVESIADHTKRPLFQISSGQLTGDAATIEGRLSVFLSTAKRWKALVLIDEADVFMQKRRIEDLERNGLVSILLRVLEYFEGIMFLTTNRLETIDNAFHSRIHLSLAYPPLSADALRTLWKNTISRACSNPNPRWLSKRLLKRLAGSKVNGRDIKNIVRMAYAMAKNEKREMRAADIRQGLDALVSFKNDFRQGVKQRRIEDGLQATSNAKSPSAEV